MKVIIKFIGITLSLGVFIFINACKGPAGDIGPAGTTGATGATGVAGPVGTANIIYSPWLTATFAKTASNYVFVSTITATQITQDILDKGDIHVYIKNGTTVFPLPYTQVDSTGYVFHVNPVFALGKIGLFSTDPLNPLPVRYVIIPGGIPSSGRKAAIDFNNYEAVKKEFNIPE